MLVIEIPDDEATDDFRQQLFEAFSYATRQDKDGNTTVLIWDQAGIKAKYFNYKIRLIALTPGGDLWLNMNLPARARVLSR